MQTRNNAHYVNNKLKYSDNESPYQWIWNEFAIGKEEGVKQKIE